jgi:hypothetical protein
VPVVQGSPDFFEQLGRTIAYHPEVARMLGNIKAALFLQQLMWWTPKGKDPASSLCCCASWLSGEFQCRW